MRTRNLAGVNGVARTVLQTAREWGTLGVVLAFMVFAVASVSAQNLVPNPSFEYYSSIPVGLALAGEINLADFWSSPTGASPDYFHSSATSVSLVSVPGNVFGSQFAATGQAYAGFHARPSGQLYREYVETPLSSPLVAGQTYQVAFRVSLASESQLAIYRIGAYLSVGPVGSVYTSYTLPFSPQVSNPVNNYIADKLNWTLISGQYVAAGGEDHIVIGNFFDDASSPSLTLPTGTQPWSYYYLDDVSVTLVPPPCVPPPLGMVAWWPADGHANDIEDGNHGTLQGGASYAPGVVGLAFDLVGGGHVEAANAANLNFVASGSPGCDLSIDAWIQIPTTSAGVTAKYLPIVDKRDLPGGAYGSQAIGYMLFLYKGNLALQLGDPVYGFYNYISSGPDLRGTDWHHVAVTVDRDSATGGHLYVDGAVVLTFDPTNRPGNFTNGSRLYIGRHAGNPAVTFTGFIDEVEIFSRELSGGEIQSIFAAWSAGKCKCALAPSDMVSWWPFDEPGGPVAHDIAGYPNDGTYVGAPTPVPGVVQLALEFDGVGDYVQVPDQAELNLGTGDFTIDAWVRLESSTPVHTILDKRSVSSSAVAGYLLFTNSGYLCLQLADGTHTNYPSGLFVADGQWHHVAVTVDRDSTTGIRWYLDGNLGPVVHDSTAHPASLDNSAPLLFAKNADLSYWLHGALDEVEIFDRVLSAQEVRSIFDAQSAGKCKCYCCGGMDLTISTGPWSHWEIVEIPSSGSTLQVDPAPLSTIGSGCPWAQPSSPNIGWVGTPCPGGTTGAGTYVYEYTFCLCSSYTDVEMRFYLWSDDCATVYLNGNPIATSTGTCWSGPGCLVDVHSPDPTVPNGFVTCTNRLRIEVAHDGVGPSGMMLSGWVGAHVGSCCPP